MARRRKKPSNSNEKCTISKGITVTQNHIPHPAMKNSNSKINDLRTYSDNNKIGSGDSSAEDNSFIDRDRVTEQKQNVESTSIPEPDIINRCLICAQIIMSSCKADENADELTTVRLLCDLFKVLKISPTIYKRIQLDHLPTPLYCTSCTSQISECLEFVTEIESLQNYLEELTGKIRDNFIESYYCRPHEKGYENANGMDAEGSSSPANFAKSQIRQTLVQCWTTSTVKIKPLSSNSVSGSEAKGILKPTKTGSSRLPGDNKFACEDNILEGVFGEPPLSPSSPCSPPGSPQPSSPLPTWNTNSNECSIQNLSSGITGYEKPALPKSDLGDDLFQPRRSRRPRQLIKTSYCDESENDADDNGNISESGSVYTPGSDYGDFPTNEELQNPIDSNAAEGSMDASLSLSSVPLRKKSQKRKQVPGSSVGPESEPIKKQITIRRFRNPRKTMCQRQLINSRATSYWSDPNRTKNSLFPFQSYIFEVGDIYSKRLETETAPIPAPKKIHTYRLQCKFCQLSYVKPSSLRKHYAQAHTTETDVVNTHNVNGALQSFYCVHCKTKFSKSKYYIVDDPSRRKKLKIKCNQQNQSHSHRGCSKVFTNFLIFSWHHGRTCSEKPTRIKVEIDEKSPNTVKVNGYYADDLKIVNLNLPSASANSLIGKLPTGKSSFSLTSKISKHRHYRHHRFKQVQKKSHQLSCSECVYNPKFPSAVHLCRHQRFSHRKISTKSKYDAKGFLASFVCGSCSKKYDRENYLTSPDPAAVQNLSIKIKCDEPGCDNEFSNLNSFKIHHSLRCCSKSNPDPAKLIKQRERNIPRTAATVGKINKQSNIFRKDPEQLRGNMKYPFSCKTCAKGYVSEGWLEVHEKCHRGEIEFLCSKCKSIYTTEKRLSVHMEKCLNKSKPKKLITAESEAKINELKRNRKCERLFRGEEFTCKYCNVEYLRASYAPPVPDPDTNKIDAGSGSGSGSGTEVEFVFRCELPGCDKSFIDFRKFCTHHQQTCFQNPKVLKIESFNCQYCDRSYSQLNAVKEHEITNHTKDYQVFCEMCGLGFYARNRLKEHQKLHHSSKKFKCQLCPKEFKKKIQFTDHMNRHNNYFPFVCEDCGKAFVGKNGLNMHMQQRHKKTAYS